MLVNYLNPAKLTLINVRSWHKADIPAFYIRSALISPSFKD